MEYRRLPRGGEELSALGIGGENLVGLPEREVAAILDLAMAEGVNIMDVYMPNPEIRSILGRVLSGRREQMHVQGHICATFQDGQYTRSRDLALSRAAFDDLLTRLGTDYIDFGMIHYVDQEADYLQMVDNGILDYARQLKKEGTVRHLGFSTHNPAIASRMIALGDFDLFMFSVNPAYDLDSTNDDDVYALMDFKGLGEAGQNGGSSRTRLYAECARQGVGITVMKALAAGRLLRAADSPFGEALTVTQCMYYSLTRPAVLSCLLGFRSVEELRTGLGYFKASEEEKNYSAIARFPRYSMSGRCVYCNHCLPCTSSIDIAAVNKLLDLATLDGGVPETVRSHYRSLTADADDCIQCGDCERNCPFGVEIMKRMLQTREVFRA